MQLFIILQAVIVDGSGNALSHSATATVAISIEDVNDNSPVLENPHADPIELLEVSVVISFTVSMNHYCKHSCLCHCVCM